VASEGTAVSAVEKGSESGLSWETFFCVSVGLCMESREAQERAKTGKASWPNQGV
jgi:hypothetical protein